MRNLLRRIARHKGELVVDALRVITYLGQMLLFFGLMSIENWPLLHLSRTLATTLLTWVAMTIAMHAIYGGYDVGRKKSKPIISSMTLGCICTDLVTYLQLQIMNVNPQNNTTLKLFGTDFVYLLICILLQTLFLTIMVRTGNRIYFRIHQPKACLLIVGEDADETALREKIGRYRLQWHVRDVASWHDENLKQRIENAEVVFMADVPGEVRMNLMKACYDLHRDVLCKAQLQDIMLSNARPAIVDDAAFLSMEFNKSSLYQRFLKRTGDIVLSALALIVFSPFILLFSLCIKMEDGGSVIFRQSRLTADGREFTIRKFRTMKPHSEDEHFQTSITVDDPRITKVGSFLRRYRLDEIPQFYNILIGDMSLVGPRPEMMANVERYKMELPSFVYREKMKAGLTGYAQIEGRYNTSAEDKLMLDLMYIESFSIWLDIKLLLRTFTILTKKDSTQGFRKEAEQKQANAQANPKEEMAK